MHALLTTAQFLSPVYEWKRGWYPWYVRFVEDRPDPQPLPSRLQPALPLPPLSWWTASLNKVPRRVCRTFSKVLSMCLQLYRLYILAPACATDNLPGMESPPPVLCLFTVSKEAT